MVLKTVKNFGKYNLHIILSKKEGYKVGDKVEIESKLKPQAFITYDEMTNYVDNAIDELKRGG